MFPVWTNGSLRSHGSGFLPRRCGCSPFLICHISSTTKNTGHIGNSIEASWGGLGGHVEHPATDRPEAESGASRGRRRRAGSVAQAKYTAARTYIHSSIRRPSVSVGRTCIPKRSCSRERSESVAAALDAI